MLNIEGRKTWTPEDAGNFCVISCTAYKALSFAWILCERKNANHTAQTQLCKELYVMLRSLLAVLADVL